MPCLTASTPTLNCFAQWIFDETKRLECGSLLSGECGHGYRGLRWELANWLGGVPFNFTSMMELMAELIQQGKLKLDKSVWAKKRFTYHDSCNIARSGGVMEEPRIVIRAAVDNFVEMEHNREESFCCGGGGGALAMPEFLGAAYSCRQNQGRRNKGNRSQRGAPVLSQLHRPTQGNSRALPHQRQSDESRRIACSGSSALSYRPSKEREKGDAAGPACCGIIPRMSMKGA